MSRHTLDDEEDLLDILGNETRRRIVQILADEPRYFNQMWRELGVSQKAVLNHLQLLEESGLIVSYGAKSELGAPDRKYYKLNKTLLLTVSISRDNVGIKMQTMSEFGRQFTLTDKRVLKLAAKVQNVLKLSSFEEIIKSSQPIMREIESRIDSIEEERLFLANLRQGLMEKLHTAIRETIEADLERKVLHTLVKSSRPMTTETLSEQLDIREKEIEQALTRLQKRFTTPITSIFQNLCLSP